MIFRRASSNPSRSWPRTRPCRGQHVLEQSYKACHHGAWLSCKKMCSTPSLRAEARRSDGFRLTTIGDDVNEALKRLSQLRDNDCTVISDVEGRKPRKKKRHSQTKIVYNTVKFGSSIQCDDRTSGISIQHLITKTERARATRSSLM